MNASEFKEFIFGMLFLKRLSDEFDRKREQLRNKDFAHLKDQPDLLKELLEEKTSYGETFFVPVRARWHEAWIDENGDEVPALKDLKHDIGNMLNKAIAKIEEENDALAGVLKNNIDFNAIKGKTKIPDYKWKDLLDHFNQPQFVLVNDNFEFPDLLGAAYEYLIKFFADSAGKKGGEFYTPAEVVRLLVQITKPEAGNEIYDPTAGSGGFLIQAHLIGGIPEAEVNARAADFGRFGIQSDSLFRPERPGYLAFREEIGTKPLIKNRLESDHSLKQVLTDHHDALEAWWQQISEAQSELAEAVETAQEVAAYEPEEDEKVTATVIKKALKALIDDLKGSSGDSARKEMGNLQARDNAIKCIEKRIKESKVALKSKTDESVQKEFAEERAVLRDYLRGDPLLRRFYDVFLFEDVPAIDRRADEVYLHEVERCDIYVGLFGKEYGKEDEKGYSPTHREFDLATRIGKHRLIFVKGANDGGKAPKMQALIKAAGDQVVRRRFVSAAELVAATYGSLVQYLDEHELIRSAPFDASFCRNATIDDLDEEKIHTFLSRARRARGFPLPEESMAMEVLTHLNLLDKERPSNAAVLLFGRQPQRFLISSELKCAHFHGVEVTKPIPFYRVYKGTVFDLVDQAVDFVLSKIDLAVGTRAQSIQAPVAYEIPPEVIREAIVNAVAHRDYTSNGSVQVMLFADRLEVWNPGTLSPPLTLAKLRKPHGSVPFNPLLAEPLYLTKYIERMGTGTGDMIKRCRNVGLDEPEFALTDGFVVTIRRKPELAFKAVGGITGEVSTKSALSQHQVKILHKCLINSGIADLMKIAGRRDRTKFRNQVLNPLIEAGYLEMTIPEKPRSSKQKYRLTEKGKRFLEGEV